MADELVISTITEYNLAVAMVSRAVRLLLPAYNGYECKEPEAAKFTLAFRCDCSSVDFSWQYGC